MNPSRKHKKNLIVSYKNLSDELKELFKLTYPEGYTDYLQRTVKPNGDVIFIVPMETEDTSYMVKFDVKIDTTLVEDDLYKDNDNEEEKEENEFAPLSEAIDKEEGTPHSVGKLQHGAYEEAEVLANAKSEALESIKQDFDMPDEEDFDSYVDEEPDTEVDDEMEPTESDIQEIESEFLDVDASDGSDKEAKETPKRATKSSSSKAAKSSESKTTSKRSSAKKK
ncbi:MAG: hypothetical protein IJ684_05845 [Bacteroidales bacterium]|nr:hypothetical protein [Bacteroidales bacterium]